MNRPDAIDLKIVRVRNEIAFIHSGRAHGGPARERELEELREQLKRLMGERGKREGTR